tara:strand:+ start:284 stop:637 length:354 start_codon:yes stop_codon:yes gene_type:complete
MKKLLSIIIIVFFSSCTPINEPKLIIENNSKITFDSIKVFTSISFPTIFYSLKPNQKAKGKVLFDVSKQGDGCYKIVIYSKGDIFKKECFGYYTNGSSLNRKFNITIEKDTIKVTSK